MIEWDGAELSDASPVLARAATNYGHYTAFSVSGAGQVKGLSLHLERLEQDSKTLFGRSLDRDLVLGSIGRVAEPGTMLRVTVYGPDLHVLVSPRPPSPLTTPSLRVRTVRWTRDEPTVKHLGLFGATRQRSLAQAAGYDDALFVTADGRLSEGPTWNVAAAFGDELVWPDDQCLPGTTRALLQATGIPWVRRPITAWGTATAVFATSAGIGVKPVTEIDGVRVPGDPALTRALQEAYAAIPGESLTSGA